ncbi:beta-ketoacyl-ACP synthase II [Spirochaetota bacterium]
MEKRIVITGMGTLNPLGDNVKTYWDNLIDGVSGVRRVAYFDPSTFTSQIAGQVPDFDPQKAYKNFSKAKRLDRFVHYAAWALKEAGEMSGLEGLIEKDPKRVGICIGSGIGGLSMHEKETERKLTMGHRRISPFYIPCIIGNMASGYLAIEYGIKGANLSIQTACATANHAMAIGFMLIKNNIVDTMITGGSEAAITEIGLGGFANMRALSTKYNDTPEKASRPFDKDRDGFVIAEGSGVLILEEYETAKKRGADILCEICSFGMTGDAYDMVMPHPDGEGAQEAMRVAIDSAGINTDSIDYINAHGTATPLGDIGETKAIKGVFKQDAKHLNISSTKSMTGHLLGAAAGVEAIATILAMKNNIIPPTINIENQDPACDLNYTANEAVKREVKIALSNSFGFGGHNSSVCFRKI